MSVPVPAASRTREDLHEPLPVERLLHRVATLHFLMSHRIVQRLGISQVELFAVSIVHLHGGLSAGELACETGLTPGATTRLIDRLERQALLRRVPDPTDRRRTVVQLDPQGVARLDADLQPLRELYANAVDGLTGPEHSGVTRYLEAAARDMEAFVRHLPPCAEVTPSEAPTPA